MKLSCARGSETHVRGSARKRLRKQMLIVRSRKGRGSRFIHDELVVAEAPRKQNQLTTHPRKLKLWSRKQRGRARGRQVGLEENYIGVFATAHMIKSLRIINIMQIHIKIIRWVSSFFHGPSRTKWLSITSWMTKLGAFDLRVVFSYVFTLKMIQKICGVFVDVLTCFDMFWVVQWKLLMEWCHDWGSHTLWAFTEILSEIPTGFWHLWEP